jgi:hypothetical protein
MKRYQSTEKNILREMAYKREKIENRILDYSPTITEHIIKLLLFSAYKDPQKDWIDSIVKVIDIIAGMKWKANNKYLPIEDYFENFYTNWFTSDTDYDQINRTVKNVLEEYNDIPTKYTNDEFPRKEWMKKIKSFYIELSEWLSKGTLTKLVLKEMIKKYFL